ncbi:hypothetical protein SRABI106_04616 [Rahnella aquatilis]|nr:hypothetical protein SRABI106_04616 [Rahnella aquatilis]
MLDGFPAFYTVIDQRRTQNILRILFQNRIDHAFDFDGFAGVITDLFIPLRKDLIEIIEIPLRQTAFLRQEAGMTFRVVPLFKRGEHHAGKVDETHAGTTIAPLAADCRFDAANGGIIISILFFDAQFDEFWNNNFIVIKGGHAKTTADHLYAGIKEVTAHSGVIAHAQIRLGGSQLSAGFQNGV